MAQLAGTQGDRCCLWFGSVHYGSSQGGEARHHPESVSARLRLHSGNRQRVPRHAPASHMRWTPLGPTLPAEDSPQATEASRRFRQGEPRRGIDPVRVGQHWAKPTTHNQAAAKPRPSRANHHRKRSGTTTRRITTTDLPTRRTDTTPHRTSTTSQRRRTMATPRPDRGHEPSRDTRDGEVKGFSHAESCSGLRPLDT